MKTPAPHYRFSAACLFAALAAPLAAQTAPTEIVTLQEFNVTTTAPSEYAATESTTGTRVSAKIRDLPFSVNAVTADFMDDFNLLEFRDQLGYTSGVVGWETLATGYSIRGFDADVQLRNGFRRIGLIDKVNVERAEVIKGPAASIYGSVLPGGTVNYVTKKPQRTAKQRVAVTVGDHDLWRTQLSSTGPLGQSNKFFYRIDGAIDSRKYDQKFKKKEQATISGQIQWSPRKDTSLLIEYEHLERREIGMSQATVPFRIQTLTPDPYRVPSQNRTYTRYAGIATEIIDFNNQGPQTYSNRYSTTLTATLEHRLSDVFSLRSSANWYDRTATREEIGGRDQFNTATRALQRGTPRYRPYPEGGAVWQNDLLASFTTGSVKHKLLLTLDYQRQTEAPERYDMTNFTAGLPASVQSGLRVDAPDYAFVSYLDNASYYAMTQKEDNAIDIYGVFVSERATLLDDRLTLLVGGRYDRADKSARDLFNKVSSKQSTNELTHQIGANYRVASGLHVFANGSSSFVPQFGVGRRADGTTYELPNETGSGWETGLKASFLAEKLTFTTTYFDIKRDNVATETTDPTTGTPVTLLTGKQASKGVEFDFNWLVLPELQLFGGYGYTDAKVVQNDNSPHLEGTTPRRVPRNNGGLAVKYDFKTGRLKGAFLTAGFKYYDRSIVNPSAGRNLTASTSNPIVNNPMPNGRLPFPRLAPGTVVTAGSARVDDGRESVANAAYTVIDAGLGYKWKSAQRYAQKVQVNVSNLADKRYTYGSSGQGERLSVACTYDLSF
ncbi:MAG: TonB-dependent receptor [Opitutae bacterium]|nr:TonB-dependent receptor [Opitutae bacterium]